MMEILVWIAVGVGAGLFAQYLLRDKWRGGMVGNLVVGAMGAVAAGWVMMRLFGSPGAPAINVGNLLFAFLGAVALLWVGRLVSVTRVHVDR